ncbi:MAG: hypothetical protein PF572_04980 [Patescibacteria group bacterium]|nr:hypothetical protein [Patescibacteria group bacterium]
MLKKTVKHIHKFRILLFSFILFSFLHTVGVSPIDYTKYLGANFSRAVGIGSSASVPPNPMNTLALQLKDKEDWLNTRESQLDKRETDLKSASSVLQNKVIWGMIIGIVVLFLLILINFVMDWRRKKKSNTMPRQHVSN